ncbi:MAG: hypothetical protein R3B48_21955 [Kofleriaceae bacterium]
MAGKRRGVGKVVSRSATSAINLSVAGAAAVGALALMSWPIAALGGAAYAALVVSDLSNPDFRRRALRASGQVGMPKVKDLQDPQLVEVVEQLGAARGDIDATLADTPARVRRNLTTTIHALDELYGHAAVLVCRARDLGTYLERTDAEDARREAKSLRARAAAAEAKDDAASSREYQLAAAAAVERLTALDDLAKSKDRIFANLARIRATLRSVPPKIVRMRALDDQASDALTGDFDQELGRMNTDLRAFEQTLESLVEVSS